MRRLIVPIAALTVLAACQQAEQPAPAGDRAAPSTETSEAGVPEPSAAASCREERGEDAAQALADRCRQVSPATRPPCNAANPCAMIQAEIDRSCALWADGDDSPRECRS